MMTELEYRAAVKKTRTRRHSQVIGAAEYEALIAAHIHLFTCCF